MVSTASSVSRGGNESCLKARTATTTSVKQEVDVLLWVVADALQNGGGPSLDLGRELSLAMALQFPAHAPESEGSPARAASSPTARVRACL